MAMVAVVAGCQSASVSVCDDGTYCASDRVCDEVHGGCVFPEAFEVCAGKADGAPCTFRDTPDGQCDQGVCVGIASICGNGVVEPREQCDDLGVFNGDGCSATCRIEPAPTWADVTPASSPSLRWGHALAYDSARKRLVLFGGFDNTDELADTWEWDGATWTEVTPASDAPSARAHHAMAYDAIRGRVVLSGGADPLPLGDTWEWDGTSWTEVTPTDTTLGTRTGHRMVYDAARGRVLLLGGGRWELWAWDGSAWSELPADPLPPQRGSFALAYDAGRDRVVLHGGHTSFAGVFGDTWEWDGTSWSEVTPTPSLPARTRHAMAYDPAFGRVVVFGGLLDDVYLDDTWAWDGVRWTMLAPSMSPSPRSTTSLAYDASLGRLVIFAGFRAGANDTWIGIDGHEACTTGIDGDGDGDSGCADLDCWGYCSPSCPPNTTCDPDAPGCGDGTCDEELESCRLCPGDCGACPARCGDLFCDPGETEASCPGDCATSA